ncbi:MAG: YfhO family protein [Chlorobi bacterium]|nr:YfhO family protein [Chlorobiota bacterium]
MSKINVNKLIPYFTAIVLFLIISLAYFPDTLQGKKLNQHDKKTWKGGAKEIMDYQKETGEWSLWTNSLFGGMPTYMVSNHAPNNWTKYIYKVLDLGHKYRPVSFIFMALLGFFIALLLFDVKPWLALIGSFAFAFSTYFLIIIEAGHITKVVAMAFMPPIIAGIYHAYNKKVFTGAIVMMIFLALQLLVNHLQITYYTLLIIIVYVIFEIVKAFKEKKQKEFIKTSSILFIAGLIAISTNFSQLITAYDYGKDSIRGKSELTINKENKTSGLDKDYATAWSYGKLETLNLMIPNLTGGASSGELSKDSEMYKEFKKLGVGNVSEIIKHMPTYWGPQPFTSGPVYIGAIIIFLFIFGLFIVKGHIKWWLFAATLLSITLAWGKNFMPLTDLFLDYFPMYNKFRTVSMILVIAEFTIPLLALLALRDVFEKKVTKEEIYKALKWSLGIVVGTILILLIPGILSFSAENDAMTFSRMFGLQQDAQSQQILQTLVSAIEQDRASLFRADAFRSLGFILVSALLLWLFIEEKLKETAFIASLGFLILVDLWTVDKRFLNSDDFVSARLEKEPFVKSEADKFILKDKDLDYRVLNLAVSTFNDASTSYFHKSIGGYSGVKMRRYQDLIDYAIAPEINMLIAAVNNGTSELDIKSALSKLSVLNMLNTKYIIINPTYPPIMNNFNLGNAWFVNEIKEVENADEEIKSVRAFNPERTAIIDKRFKEQFFKFKKDDDAKIILTNYAPNKLKYKSKAQTDQLAVFSEIYYGKGWNAYIDGKLVPHMRANYVLRAMRVPAGKHTIEFKFEPSIWEFGNTVSLIGSIIFFIILLGSIGFYFYNKRNTEEGKTENAK